VADVYTNVRHRGVLSTQIQYAVPARPAPYVSNRTGSALTEKERVARRLGVAGSASVRSKVASYCGDGGAGGGMGGGGGGFGFGGMGGNTSLSNGNSFFSPQLSTDFLELPQSLRERREVYAHYSKAEPIIKQALSLHTKLPLSKMRLTIPRPRTCPKRFGKPNNYGRYIHSFFEKMCLRLKLFERLSMATRHYWLDGNAFLFAEDGVVEVPENVGHRLEQRVASVLTDEGEAIETVEEEVVKLPDWEDRELAYFQKHYRGWERLVVLPMDQIKLTSFDFGDKCRIEMIPSERTRALIEQAKSGDEKAQELIADLPAETREYIEKGELIPLGTDPDEGSFCYHWAAERLAGEDLGSSMLDCVLRTLTYREKLRQAQTMIASRNMTPKRVVWGEGLSAGDVEDLREQVDLSLVDPDYSIVTNYEVHWDEYGSKDRLLDLAGEYELTDKQLYAGLGVTESLLNGESTYAGDRVKLEILNTIYLDFRESIQHYVEEYLFKPVARRKGFVENDEWGDETVIYPKLSFTRLALRDSQDTYDALFNLYQKGSINIDLILEMFNIDPAQTREKLEKDLFTVNDATFNEVVRGLYGEVGRELATSTNAVERIAKYLKLEKKAEPGADEPESRF
jgi:hypothetical protein